MPSPLFKGVYRVDSTRLSRWNYSSPGYYYVTICTKNRRSLFGVVKNNKMKLSALGQICNDCWIDLPNHYRNCALDECIVMPNHVHGIILIRYDVAPKNLKPCSPNVETGLKPVSTTNIKRYSLSEIIRGFKTFSAKKMNILNGTPGTKRWQSRFYDRIIRNEKELYNVRKYIRNNPIKWKEDSYFL